MLLARRLMDEQGVRHLPVLDFDRVIGIVSDRDVLRCPSVHAAELGDERARDDASLVRAWMTTGVVFLREYDEVETAAARMLDHGIGGVPIISDRGGLVALITEAELVRYFARHRPPGDEEGFAPVVEHMEREVHVVAPEAPLHHAIMLFTDHPIRHLPVLEGERPVGMLSDGDVFAFLARARAGGVSPFDAANRCVRDAMQSPVPCVNQLFTVIQAAQLMQRRNVEALPVVRERKLIGIFTTRDVLRFVANRGNRRGNGDAAG